MNSDIDGGDITARIRNIAEIIKTKRNVAVLPHNTADGDTLGSCLAVSIALQKLGIDVALIYEELFPESLSVLKTGHSFFAYTQDVADIFNRSWDAVAVLDVADPKLLGKRARLLGQTDCVINLDHHVSNLMFGRYNLVDVNASATAEIAYHLNLALGVPLDRDAALAIYTGICTDTGGFSYSNTSAESHEIAAKTLEFGIDVEHLRYKFFDAITLGKLHCHGYVANTIKLYENGKYAIAVVSAETLKELGADEADCEGLVNIGRNIVGVEVSLFAREVRPNEFRINLRSRGHTDVAKIAKKFNGGGHKLAAGCTIAAPPGEIESILIKALASA